MIYCYITTYLKQIFLVDTWKLNIMCIKNIFEGQNINDSRSADYQPQLLQTIILCKNIYIYKLSSLGTSNQLSLRILFL